MISQIQSRQCHRAVKMGGLIATKLPLEKVSRFLRHNRLESTMVYLNISINDLKRAIIRIDNDDYIKCTTS